MAIDETYSVSGFYETLHEACDLLAELYYIDKALDYFEESQHGGIPNNNAFSNTSDYAIVEFNHMGWTHPFDKNVTRGNTQPSFDDFREEAEGKLKEWADEGSTWARGIREWVVEYATDLLSERQSEFDFIIERTADTANSPAHDGAEDFGGLSENLGAWKGRTRDAFVNDWYKPFKDIRSNHCFVPGRVSACYAVANGVTSSAQHALMNAVEATKQAADDQLRKRRDDNRGQSTKDALGLLSSLTGFLGAVTFAIPPASATFGIVSATSGLASATIPAGARETVTVEGASAKELESSLDELIRGRSGPGPKDSTNWRPVPSTTSRRSRPSWTSVRPSSASTRVLPASASTPTRTGSITRAASSTDVRR
ncbi:hypothetical protein [Nocardioides sp. B-3]|uniref:hypothetical protein n=1 Tax=Nocardioides sp. B-3 TaxID=2895565 RepID=UPI00215224C6|nr:hypothetical protein [Nocardioides sp. B-3]UUZ60858.1 hypothetical protein LP418_09055 [Nocardioides sp. B-3]